MKIFVNEESEEEKEIDQKDDKNDEEVIFIDIDKYRLIHLMSLAMVLLLISNY